jgi:stage V sporulation protein D (sporulation-specific penicillin-binding protein)
MQENNNSSFKPNIRRLGIVTVIIIVFLGLVSIKLVKIKLIDAGKFIGDNTTKNEPSVILPTRGEIYDRNEVPLVSNTLACDIFCEPIRIENKGGVPDGKGNYIGVDGKPTTEGVANILASVLSINVKDALESVKFIEKKQEWFSYIKRCVDPGTAQKLDMYDLKGVYTRDTHKRYYPQGNLASNILGYTDTDSVGIEGIEKAFNTKLTGSEGFKTYTSTINSNLAPAYIVEKPAIQGQNIFLTIDSSIQFIAEQRMREALNRWDADAAVCIIQDPSSGEILAAAQSIRKGLEKKYPLNMPLKYQFEPGSVFKGVTTAIGLDCGAIDEKIVLSDNGGIRKGDINFTCDWISAKGHGSQNLVQAIRNSCNVVFVQYGQRIIDKIGGRKFYEKLLQFGFGSEPGTGLSEDKGGVQKPEIWYASSPWNMFFGRGITLTPMQLVMAYSSIANGGVLMKPKLVKKIYDPNNGNVEEMPNQVLRQVVSENAAKRAINALTQNVIWNNYDTAFKAAMKGYSIAGKTGTANQINPDGGYFDNAQTGIRYNCSFIGILPTDQETSQKLTILVTVVNPNNTKPPYETLVGSNVAAPYFRLVAEDVTSLLRIGPKDEIKKPAPKSKPAR